MFSFLRNVLIHRRNNLRFLQTPIPIRSISSISPTNHPSSSSSSSSTASYLINSYGLSKQNAIAISKNIQQQQQQFETPTQPHSVLTLLKNVEFTQTHISKTISKFPMLLCTNVDQTLKPMFLFFYSKGFIGRDLADALSEYPFLLGASLEETIIPSFNFLQSVVHKESNVIAILKHRIWLLTGAKELLAPKIATLRSHGVPDFNIETFLVNEPQLIADISNCRFDEIVKEVKEMEFHPKQYGFLIALKQLVSLSAPNRKNLYTERGWSEDEIQYTFGIRCPYICQKRRVVWKYLENEIGYDRGLIFDIHNIDRFSFTKTIFPRFSVARVLFEEGLVQQLPYPWYILRMREKHFRKKFVFKFKTIVPELLGVYEGLDERFKTLSLKYLEELKI